MSTIKISLMDYAENKHICTKPVIPTYGTEKSAGFDLYSAAGYVLKKNTPTVIHTGLKMQIPVNTELQIRPRSGLALSDGITVLNTPGTIDEDYRGEIMVILYWTGYRSKYSKFNLTNDGCISIPAKTRIAQGILTPVLHPNFEIVNKLDDEDRGTGGFGHTGLR